MFLSLALRAGATVAAALAETSVQAPTARADARPRLPLLPQRHSRRTGEEPQEGPSIEIDLRDDGSIFSSSEISDTVEEIVGLCDTGYGALRDEGGSSSSVQMHRTRARERQFTTNIFRATERMVNNPGVQTAAIDAMREDAELRRMIEELSNCHFTLVDSDVESITMSDLEAPEDANSDSSWWQTLCAIGRFFRRVYEAIKGSVGRVASWLKSIVSWIIRSIRQAMQAVAAVVAAAVSSTSFAGAAAAAGVAFPLTVELFQAFGRAGLSGPTAAAVFGDSAFPSAVRFIGAFGLAGRAGPIVTAAAMLVIVMMIIRRRHPHEQEAVSNN